MTTKQNMILFGGGFLSHNIAKFFQNDYNLVLFCRKYVDRGVIYNKIFTGLDLTTDLDYDTTDYDIFDSDRPNILINCAAAGTNRKDWDNKDTFIDNILMYKTFSRLCLECGYYKQPIIINFGSGAEFISSGYYGMSKETILSFATAGRWLRLYGMFGEAEREGRFVSTCFEKIIKNEDLIIQDKMFDFYSVYDLCTFIKNQLSWNVDNIQFECVYDKPVALFDIAKYILSLYPEKPINLIYSQNFNKNYISPRNYQTPKLSGYNSQELGLFASLKKLKEEYYDKF